MRLVKLTDLIAVRDLRARREETARAALRQAESAVAQAHRLRREAGERLAAFDAAVDQRMREHDAFAAAQGMTGVDIMAARSFHDHLRARRPAYLNLVHEAAKALKLAQSAAERQRATWSAAHRAVEAMDAVIDETRLALLKERLRREEAMREELATLRRRPAGLQTMWSSQQEIAS